MKTKKCFRCQTEKKISEFGNNKQKRDGLSVYCKPCLINAINESRERNGKKPFIPKEKKEKMSPEDRNKSNHLRKFNLSLPAYKSMLLDQNNCCAICKDSFIGVRIYVDHCHKNKNVRGLLCLNCNITLGHVKDNIETLKTMINYLSV